MMVRWLLGLFLAFAPMATAGATETDAADRAAIEEVVYDYFHGQGEASAERMNRAFAAEHAVMIGGFHAAEGDTLRTSRDMREVIARWAANPNPPGGARDSAVMDLEVVDGRIATVMFRSADQFYDALTLIKVNGEWKIVSKVFVRQ